MNRILSLLLLIGGCFAAFASTAEAGYIDGMSQYRAYFVPVGVDPSGQHSIHAPFPLIDTMSSGCYDQCVGLGYPDSVCLNACGVPYGRSGESLTWLGIPTDERPEVDAGSEGDCECKSGQFDTPTGVFPVISRPLSPHGISSYHGTTTENCEPGDVQIMKYPGVCYDKDGNEKGDCCKKKCWIYKKFKCEKHDQRHDSQLEEEFVGRGKNKRLNPNYNPDERVLTRWIILNREQRSSKCE